MAWTCLHEICCVHWWGDNRLIICGDSAHINIPTFDICHAELPEITLLLLAGIITIGTLEAEGKTLAALFVLLSKGVAVCLLSNEHLEKVDFHALEVREILLEVSEHLFGRAVGHFGGALLRVEVLRVEIEVDSLERVHVRLVILVAHEVDQELLLEGLERLELQSADVQLLDVFQEVEDRVERLRVELRLVQEVALQVQDTQRLEAALELALFPVTRDGRVAHLVRRPQNDFVKEGANAVAPQPQIRELDLRDFLLGGEDLLEELLGSPIREVAIGGLGHRRALRDADARNVLAAGLQEVS